MVLEYPSRTVPYFNLMTPPPKQHEIFGSLPEVMMEMIPLVQEHMQRGRALSERDFLIIVVLRTMLKNVEADQAKFTQRANVQMLRQATLLRHLPLLNRSLRLTRKHAALTDFLDNFTEVASQFIEHSAWSDEMRKLNLPCDIVDLIDGRLLGTCCADYIEDFFNLDPNSPPSQTLKFLLELTGLSPAARQTFLKKKPRIMQSESVGECPLSPDASNAVLPFSNVVFDRHLQYMRLSVDSVSANSPWTGPARDYKEDTH